jgi:hypothetical protein
VGDEGVEPSTSFLSGKRSTGELITQKNCFAKCLLLITRFYPKKSMIFQGEPLSHAPSFAIFGMSQLCCVIKKRFYPKKSMIFQDEPVNYTRKSFY